MKKIIPNIDLQNSIQRDRILESRDFYKGKSFRYLGVWEKYHTYYNDDWYTDFVSYGGALLACNHTHMAANEPELIRDDNGNIYGVQSSDWSFVMAGTPGPQGKVFSPNYNELTGKLSWELTDGTESIKPVVIKGKDAIQPEFKIEDDPNTGRSQLVQYLGDDRTPVGEINAVAVRFANTLPPESEAKNYAGQIVVVENDDGDGDNDYLEYIAVRTGDATDYKWELIGGSGNISENDIKDLIDEQIGDSFDAVDSKINSINSSVKEINTTITAFNTRIDNLENSTSNAPLKEVRMNEQEQKLEFVYEINGETKVIKTDISDVIVNEEVGEGLANNDGIISVKVADDDQYLSVTDAGLSTTNLDSKFQSVDTSIININKEIASIKEEVTQTENIDGGRFEWE